MIVEPPSAGERLHSNREAARRDGETRPTTRAAVSIDVAISDRDGLPAEAQIPVLSAVEACPEHVEGRETGIPRAPVRTFGAFAAVQDSRGTVNLVNFASGEILQNPIFILCDRPSAATVAAVPGRTRMISGPPARTGLYLDLG
jgi:hypothetical protein